MPMTLGDNQRGHREKRPSGLEDSAAEAGDQSYRHAAHRSLCTFRYRYSISYNVAKLREKTLLKNEKI
jgi:hypothetical protein